MFDGDLCNQSGFLTIILLVKNVIKIVQIAVPVILILLSMWDIVRLVISSSVEFKKTIKKIVGRTLAAVFVFMVPVILNMVLSFLTETTSLQGTECWIKANNKTINELKREEQDSNDAQNEAATGKKDYAARAAEALSLRKGLLFESSTPEVGTVGPTLPAVEGQCVTAPGPYNNVGNAIVEKAKQYLGNPYVYGGTDLNNGTDCSGFTQGIYAQFGASIPRTTYTQVAAGQNVGTDLANAKVGDLLIFDGHAGIYMGNNQMIHASSPETGIIIGNARYASLVAIRRVICS